MSSGAEETLSEFLCCTVLDRSEGYDGVEIMGSEGYLFNQFLAGCTNQRDDEYGGTFNNRMRISTDIVREIRNAVGKDFILMFRLSMINLILYGSSWDKITELAMAL